MATEKPAKPTLIPALLVGRSLGELQTLSVVAEIAGTKREPPDVTRRRLHELLCDRLSWPDRRPDIENIRALQKELGQLLVARMTGREQPA